MPKKEMEIQESRRLRVLGWSLRSISKELKVSPGSVSLWIRDLPQPKKFTKEYRRQQKEERLRKIAEERLKNKRVRKDRILSGCGYWMIPVPPNYKGKVYSCGYIYEHRYVLEEKLGRFLTTGEIAHHINEDRTDNRPENVELKKTIEHLVFHGKDKSSTFMELKCPWCKKMFIRRKNQTHLIRGGSGTFCSASCRGQYGRSYQLKRISTEEISQILSENIVREFRAPVSQLDLESGATNTEVPSSSLGGGMNSKSEATKQKIKERTRNEDETRKGASQETFQGQESGLH